MKWYFVVLTVIVYLLIGALTAWIDHKFFDEQDTEEAIACGLLWPFAVILLIGGTASGVVLQGVEKIADWWDKMEKA